MNMEQRKEKNYKKKKKKNREHCNQGIQEWIT